MRASRVRLFLLLCLFCSSAALAAPQNMPNIGTPSFADWLWNLGGGDALARSTVIAIALLSAFLTAVEVWQIPPSATRLGSSISPGAQQENPAGLKSEVSSSPTETRTESTPFLRGNFATTVISGLGGMAAVSFLGIWKDGEVSPKTYYLVLFVLFFLVFLFGSALLRGFGEALRSRLSVPYEVPSWEPSNGSAGNKILGWLSYRLHRIWAWVLSYRATVLVFVDTSFNVLQGKNQLQSAVFSDRILELQWSLVRTVDRVRENIAKEVLAALRHEYHKGATDGEDHPNSEDVRVNVCMLSPDGSSVFYVSRDEKSLPTPFGRRSVAWYAIANGVARWCKLNEKGELFYPEDVSIRTGETGKDEGYTLDDYFERRPEPGYSAFMVIPVPWLGRREEGDHRRAGIVISFANEKYLEDLWVGLENKSGAREIPNYKYWSQLLQLRVEVKSERLSKMEKVPPGEHAGISIKNPGLHAVLHESVVVLEEVLRYFNDTIFEDYIKPHRWAA